MTTNTMRVYVGTYAKYNNGSIAGAWLDISDYPDREDFDDACKELHKDESDPEFMFQDNEGFPEGMISESHIDDDVFDLAQHSEDELELFTIYRSDVDQNGTIESAIDEYRGTYDSPADYAQGLTEECGDLENVPEFLKGHIDWESVARDMSYGSTTFVQHNGMTYVFVS